MGGVGGIIRSLSGTPKVSVTRQVKNKTLGPLIDSAIGQYSTNKTATDTALSDYISKYLANAPTATANTTQESGAISQFYNGDMANQLAALRASRSAAVNSAADVAAAQATRGVNASQLGNEGSGSSYNTRLAIGATAPIRVQAAVDNANQERSDLGYVTQNQLALTGQRNQLANTQAAYGLVPEQVRQQVYGQDIGNLGKLTALDQANTFYGLQQAPNMWADFADSADQGIMNAASIASSFYGGGGAPSGGGVSGGGSGFGGGYRGNSADEGFGNASYYARGGLVRRRMDGYADGGYISNLWNAIWGGSPNNQQDPGFPSGIQSVEPAYSNQFPQSGFYAGYERGGPVRGPGTTHSDSIPIHVSEGEFIMPAAAVRMPGVLPLLERIRSKGLARDPQARTTPGHFAGGGLSGAATALQARVDRDLAGPNWQPGNTSLWNDGSQDSADPMMNAGMIRPLIRRAVSVSIPIDQGNVVNRLTPRTMINPDYAPKPAFNPEVSATNPAADFGVPDYPGQNGGLYQRLMLGTN